MKKIIYFLIIFIILSSSVLATSMSSIKTYIDYKEGLQKEIQGKIYNNANYAKSFTISSRYDDWGVLSYDKRGENKSMDTVHIYGPRDKGLSHELFYISHFGFFGMLG